MKLGVIVAALVLALAGAGAAQSPGQTKPAPKTPDFKVDVAGDLVADFHARITAYAKLRAALEEGLPKLAVTDNPTEISIAEAALAVRIRNARAGAGRGAIFSRSIRAAFRQLLRLETNPNTCAAVLDENPGKFSYRINGAYPKTKSLSTVPPGILAALPRLPADVNYRFIDRDLILHDTRANVILDRIEDAIRCPWKQ